MSSKPSTKSIAGAKPRIIDPDHLTNLFNQLNTDLFSREIPSIIPTWSRRLTRTAGVFWWKQKLNHPIEYGIRLSQPLLANKSEADLKSILVHEMIHAWVCLYLEDLNHGHGVYFRTKMAQINRMTDEFQVTRFHHFGEDVRKLAKFRWDCQSCGQVYLRQRNSIDPRRHRCGSCHGRLATMAVEPIS